MALVAAAGLVHRHVRPDSHAVRSALPRTRHVSRAIARRRDCRLLPFLEHRFPATLPPYPRIRRHGSAKAARGHAPPPGAIATVGVSARQPTGACDFSLLRPHAGPKLRAPAFSRVLLEHRHIHRAAHYHRGPKRPRGTFRGRPPLIPSADCVLRHLRISRRVPVPCGTRFELALPPHRGAVGRNLAPRHAKARTRQWTDSCAYPLSSFRAVALAHGNRSDSFGLPACGRRRPDRNPVLDVRQGAIHLFVLPRPDYARAARYFLSFRVYRMGIPHGGP